MGIFDIFRISQIKQENEQLKTANANLYSQIAALGVNEYYQTQEKIDYLENEANKLLSQINNEIASNNKLLARLQN